MPSQERVWCVCVCAWGASLILYWNIKYGPDTILEYIEKYGLARGAGSQEDLLVDGKLVIVPPINKKKWSKVQKSKY